MKKNQIGMTLIEVVAALAIMGVVMVMAQQMTSRYLDDTKNQIAASQLKQVIDASQSYIKDNYTTVVSGATPTTPLNITVAQLVAGNYLPSGFIATNAFNQTVTTYALEPVANQIVAVVISTGGTTINDSDLGYITAAAAKDGTKAGAVRSTATTSLTGAMGGWAIPLTTYGVTPGAGHLGGAIWFSATGVLSDYLYRDAVPGHPEANRMNTNLDLGGNRLTALQVIATIGSACGAGVATGDLANGPAGEVLSCQAGTWKTQGGGSLFWKDPVATYAALPLIANNAGDVRLVSNINRTFSWNGAAWVANGIDQNGNLSVPGTLGVTGAITGASVSTAGLVSAAGGLNTGLTATIGGACAGTGTMAKDAAGTGLILSCQSGSWQKAGADGAAVGSGQVGTYCAAYTRCGRTGNPYGVCITSVGTFYNQLFPGSGFFTAGWQALNVADYTFYNCTGGVIFGS